MELYFLYSSLPDPESRRKSRIDQVFELLQANHLRQSVRRGSLMRGMLNIVYTLLNSI